MSTSDTSSSTGGGGAPGPGSAIAGVVGINVSSSGSGGVTTGGTITTGEHLKIIKTQLIPHHPTTAMLQQHQVTTLTPSSSSVTTLPHSSNIATTHITSATPHHHVTNSITPHSLLTAPIQLKNATNLYSLNPVAAKITHVKTSTIDGSVSSSSCVGLGTSGTSGISLGSGLSGASGTTIMTSGLTATPTGAIKVATGSGGVTSSLALNSVAQSNTATAIRAIGSGGQSTQVRVVVPTAITPSIIKQLEGAAAGRTQITAIPASAARTVSNTSITVTRPVTQTTYLPRAAVTATQMPGIGVGVGMTTGQRLVTPIRTTTTGGGAAGITTGGPTTVTGLTAAGSFVRGTATAVSRNSSSPASTVISPATSTTWMAANTTGHVQLIRTIPHQSQSRQRIITQGIASSGGVASGTTIGGATVSGAIVATGTPVQTGVVQGVQQGQQPQTQGAASTIQAVASQGVVPHSQQQPSQQQTYVATLATVLPPRQHPATLVYSSNVAATSQPLSQSQQFSPTIATGQRFTVATQLTAATGTGAAPRQIRPIPLGKSFSAAKLNTTSISIRAPNLPQLTPTLATTGVMANAVATAVAAAGASNPPRSTVSGVTGSATNVIPTTNLPTTRIIQLQQQPGGTTQQIIGSTGRLAGNVMLQPIIVNTSGGGKLGLRPPVSMATKVQPSLTITQLGIGKLPGAAGSAITPQNVSASIQTLSGSSAGVSTPASGLAGTNLSATGGATTQLVNVSQAGHLLTTQNIVSSAAGGATVVPLAITTRGGAGGNILTGTITPIKSANSITVGKVLGQTQHVTAAELTSSGATLGGSGAPTGTSVYIHHAGSAAASGNSTPQRSHSGGSGVTVVSSSTPVSNSATGGVVNTGLSSTSGSAAGTFLPPGSTIYYESVPANSVQVSTGVLSLTTTTVTSSTHTPAQQQLISSGNSGLAISALPFSAAGNATATATFTVVPSSGGTGRTIGQLQIPVSNAAGGTQIQAVPLRFSAQLGASVAVSSSNTNNSATTSISADGTPIATVPPTVQTHVVQGAAISSSVPGAQQILLPAVAALHAPVANSATVTLSSGQSQAGGPQHMVIPLPTSIKVTTGGNASSSGPISTIPAAIVPPTFLRKREADGSPKRAAKNLGPALISMGSSTSHVITGSPAASSVGSSYSITSTASGSTSSITAASVSGASGLTTEVLVKKERAVATVAPSISGVCSSSARSSRAESPASSDGSTTVSANSSPGVDQQLQDGSLVINRISGTNDAMHFSPINEMYSNHHSLAMQHNLSGTSASSRNSLLEHQHIHVVNVTNSQRMNGGPIECIPRKKSRRSTNDSQHSAQSQASFSLPPPNMGMSIAVNNSTGGVDAVTTLNNGNLMAASSHEGTVTILTHHKNNNNAPPTAGNKENAKPAEYVLRRPSNCTLLNGYKHSWKPANNHFQRYSDVKPRDERRPNVIDLANQANVLGKINGWKIYHLRSQMEDLCENESLGYEKLSTMLTQMEAHEKNPEIERISDLLKGNMQRSKIIVDGVNEAQNQIMKIFEHKSHISDIIHRCASKRNFKKREKI